MLCQLKLRWRFSAGNWVGWRPHPSHIPARPPSRQAPERVGIIVPRCLPFPKNLRESTSNRRAKTHFHPRKYAENLSIVKRRGLSSGHTIPQALVSGTPQPRDGAFFCLIPPIAGGLLDDCGFCYHDRFNRHIPHWNSTWICFYTRFCCFDFVDDLFPLDDPAENSISEAVL